MRKVLQEIEAERLRQDEKWGQQNHSPEKWNIILDEEIGEFKRELCEAVFEKHDDIKKRRLQKMREELIQTAAVAVVWVESLDRNELKSESLLEDEREFLEQIEIKGNTVLIVCSKSFNHRNQILKELVEMGAVRAEQLNSSTRNDLKTVYGSQIKIWEYGFLQEIRALEVGYVLYLIEGISSEDKAIIDGRIRLKVNCEAEPLQDKQSDEQPVKAEPAQTEQFTTKKDLKWQKRFHKIVDLIDEHAVPISKQMIKDGHLWRYELAMAGNKKFKLSIYTNAFDQPHLLFFSQKRIDKAIALIYSFKKPAQDLIDDTDK